jgi:hypothetical protein
MRTLCFALLALAPLLVACTSDEREPTAEAAPADATPAEQAPTALPRTASPEGARVFFISPTDGETVTNPITVVFGIEGMTVVPAGDNTAHSGHHHLLIDTDLPDPGLPIPKDDNHVLFGDGSTAPEITLAPGEHTLQLMLGDHLHIPHDPPVVSEQITIRVE